MSRTHRGLLWSCLLLFATTAFGAAATEAQRVSLSDWKLQSSCQLTGKGDVISTAKFVPQGWHPVAVPSTVVAALVADKTYPDPFYGKNLRSIPGTTYPPQKLFSRLPMPDDSPFKCSWWYRTEFRAPHDYQGKAVALHFGGINYRANIWLNGRQLANSSDVAGAYRTYEFDISRHLNADEPNVLAVEVFAPTEKDLAINWVDWAPAPPDKNMGLWREVFLTASGPVAIRYPQVRSHVDTKTLKSAELTITAELQNRTGHAVAGVIEAKVEDIHLRQNVELGPNETKLVTFEPAQYPELKLANPRLWWPYQMGTPNLYTLELQFASDSAVSDAASVQFGIREVTSEFTDQGHRVFSVNGKRILIRGGGWAPDMLLRSSPARLKAEFDYVRNMNLNTIRLEGKLESDEFYSLADQYGILIMPGWCCCDIWEQWKDWPAGNLNIAVESLKSQVLRMRSHPSIFVWLNGSDNPPTPQVEQAYLDVLKQYNWPNPVISSATQQPTTVTGPSGVKMTGPYDWIAPSYWFLDAKHGGAYGFNTETGPGPAPPPPESVRKFIPADHLWPIDDVWNYHAGLGGFTNMDVFRTAMKARYGEPANLEEFSALSQVMAYEGERSMFEAYSHNKYTSTGVIQWMLNNAWPSLIWHLYDYYLMPAGGYFGAKKACEPVHALYAHDDHSVYLVNSTYQPVSGLKLTTTVYNFDLTQKHVNETVINLAEDSSQRAFVVPELPDLSTTYFLRLELHDRAGKLVSSNFYWLSTKPDAFDWNKTDYRRTPVTAHGDFTGLRALPKVNLQVSGGLQRNSEHAVARIRVKNPSKSLAFMVRLRVLDRENGSDILPILWDDNFISLLPGEERELTGTYLLKDSPESIPVIQVEGVNVAPATVKLSS